MNKDPTLAYLVPWETSNWSKIWENEPSITWNQISMILRNILNALLHKICFEVFVNNKYIMNKYIQINLQILELCAQKHLKILYFAFEPIS